MTTPYEIAIVGGGPAGVSTALHLLELAPALARRCILLERAYYPRDKPCAGAIGARALPLLSALGLDLGVAAQRIDAFSVEIGGGVVHTREPAGAWVIRRLDFDQRLAEAAMARGFPIRQGVKVVGLSREADHVRLELNDAAPIRARVVVGADGVGGIVRRALGLPRGGLRAQAAEVDTERVPGDAPIDTIRFVFDPELRGYSWDFPTPLSGRVLMSRGVYLLRDRRDDERVQAHLAAHLASRGLDLSAHTLRQFAERGLEPGAQISAARVLLVGEAAGIDFPTGEGIAQALAYGAVAAPYLVRALAQDRLDFADWRTQLFASAEGRFLYRRWLGGRVLFGPARPAIEHALLRSPKVWRLVLRRFAGRPVRGRELALALGELGLGLAGGLVSTGRNMLGTARKSRSA